MLRNELKKLFIKQYGLIMIIFLIIVESTLFLFLYKEKTFNNEAERRHFNYYMEKMQGKLTDEKETFILNEQESILNAESELRELQRKLYSGKINDESEYDILFANIQNELQKKSAFEMAFSKYKYAAQNPEKRYIISADCDGVCRDYPDIPALILVTAYGALFFMTEESSKMITLIRSCTNGKKNIFFAKITSFFILIFLVQLVISVCEMIFICNEIGTEKLGFPLQSLEYFGGCRYNISILDAFICIQLLKLAGLLFIGSLTATIVIIFKRSVPAVSCSLSISLIEQFVFSEKQTAYYFPTGLLRAVGYFRGDAYETTVYFGRTVSEKVFSEVPLEALNTVIAADILLICILIFFGSDYYKGNRKKIKKRGTAALSALIIISFLSGCSQDNGENDTEQYFNLKTAGFFSQNDKVYICFEDDEKRKLIAVNKQNGKSFEILRDPFESDILADNCCIDGDDLYIFSKFTSKGFAVYKVNLNTYDLETVISQSIESRYSFLGIRYDNDVILDKTILSVFVSEDNFFFISSDGEVYISDMDMKNMRCIISDGVYDNNLICCGGKIYYVNNKLTLMCYDIQNGDFKTITDEFVRTFDVCDDVVVFSGNDGIFSLNPYELSTKKLTDMNADSVLAYDGGVVFLSGNSLYALSDSKSEKIHEGNIINFSIIKGKNSVICSEYIYDKKTVEKTIIEILK